MNRTGAVYAADRRDVRTMTPAHPRYSDAILCRAMPRSSLTLTLLILCVLPATADAYSAPVDRGLGVGQRLFGPAKCGTVTVRTEDAPARWPQLRHAIAWADKARCAIVLNAHPTVHLRTPEARCHTIVHEYGHLAEYRDPLNPTDPQHSHDPRSVMFAENDVVEGHVMRHGRAVSAASGYVRGCSRHAPVWATSVSG